MTVSKPETVEALARREYTDSERELLDSLGGYQKVFNAIADATSVYAEGVGVNVSVHAFICSANRHRLNATPSRQDGLREADASLIGLLRALANDCRFTDGWEDGAETCEKAADRLAALSDTPPPDNEG